MKSATRTLFATFLLASLLVVPASAATRDGGISGPIGKLKKIVRKIFHPVPTDEMSIPKP